MFFIVELSNLNTKKGLCISLGANIDSKFGSPLETLIKCKPDLESIIKNWINNFNSTQNKINFRNTKFYWSSIYKTKPYGIIEKQPDYLNKLLLVKSELFPAQTNEAATFLMNNLKKIEYDYGREQNLATKKWLPRCLDLDIIWWENFTINTSFLTLPHPRFFNRNFVITPLSEILTRSQKIEKLDIN